MIRLLRVDHRLLHGQVAFSWTQFLGTDCILIANDGLMADKIRMQTINLAKPQGVKVVMKNIEDSIAAIKSGVTDKYNLFIVVESVEDAITLAESIDDIKQINLGGTKPREGTSPVSKAVNLTEVEIAALKEIEQDGIEVEIRQVPNDIKQSIK